MFWIRTIIGSNHKYSDEEYFRLIKHELAHVLSSNLSDANSELDRNSRSLGPCWLWEGVSVYLAGQIFDENIKLHSFLEYYDKFGPGVYAEGGIAVKYLVEKHGKAKLLALIKSMKDVKSEDEFKKLFKRIYGFELEYRNFTNTDSVQQKERKPK